MMLARTIELDILKFVDSEHGRPSLVFVHPEDLAVLKAEAVGVMQRRLPRSKRKAFRKKAGRCNLLIAKVLVDEDPEQEPGTASYVFEVEER